MNNQNNRYRGYYNHRPRYVHSQSNQRTINLSNIPDDVELEIAVQHGNSTSNQNVYTRRYPVTHRNTNDNTVRYIYPRHQVNTNQYLSSDLERLVTNLVHSIVPEIVRENIDQYYDDNINLDETSENEVTNIDESFLDPIPISTSLKLLSEKTEISVKDSSEEICTICRENMNEGEVIRTICGCQHKFHISCIEKWLSGNIRCPICRNDLRDNHEQNSDHIDESYYLRNSNLLNRNRNNINAVPINNTNINLTNSS